MSTKGPYKRGCEGRPETKYRIRVSSSIGNQISITFLDGVFRKYGKLQPNTYGKKNRAGNYYANATDALDGLGRAVAANATEDSLNAKFKNFKSKLDELPAFYAKPPVGKQVDLNKTFDIGMGFGGGITGVDFLVDQLYVNGKHLPCNKRKNNTQNCRRTL